MKNLELHTNNGVFKWEIRGDFNCNAHNCIYLAICRHCNIRYVGNTFDFRLRMNNHASQQYSNNSCSFFKHRQLTNHNFRDFNLFVVMGNLPRDKIILKDWESFFIDRFDTLHPIGLNFQEEI
jgi:hypothetical protein